MSIDYDTSNTRITTINIEGDIAESGNIYTLLHWLSSVGDATNTFYDFDFDLFINPCKSIRG